MEQAQVRSSEEVHTHTGFCGCFLIFLTHFKKRAHLECPRINYAQCRQQCVPM